jgi:hypothetical protein
MTDAARANASRWFSIDRLVLGKEDEDCVKVLNRLDIIRES